MVVAKWIMDAVRTMPRGHLTQVGDDEQASSKAIRLGIRANRKRHLRVKVANFQGAESLHDSDVSDLPGMWFLENLDLSDQFALMVEVHIRFAGFLASNCRKRPPALIVSPLTYSPAVK